MVNAIDNIQYVAGISYFSVTSQLLVVNGSTDFPQTVDAPISLTPQTVWTGTMANGMFDPAISASCTSWIRTTGILANAVSGEVNSSSDNGWNNTPPLTGCGTTASH